MKKVILLFLMVSANVFAQNSKADMVKFFHHVEKLGAMNGFVHDLEVGKKFKEQTKIKPAKHMVESHALVDVSAGAILSISEETDRVRIIQVIDSKGKTFAVFSEPGEYEIEVPDDFIYIYMRTEYDPNKPNDKQKAIELAKSTKIISDSQGAFTGREM